MKTGAKEKSDQPARQINVHTTLFKAVAVLIMLVISVIGLCYTSWLLWTLPAKK